MNIGIELKPDRKVESLFAVIVTDPATGLEGIGGFSTGGGTMQAVSSSYQVIEKALERLRAQPWNTKYNFKIVEFVRGASFSNE